MLLFSTFIASSNPPSRVLLIDLKCSGRLLQSHEHRPLLSDKDYASSLCTPSSSLTAVVPPPVPLRACRSPQFAEDDKEILEMKLNRTESSVGAESRQDDLDAALLLPKAFLDLEVIFEQVIKILATAHVRGGKRGTPLENLKDDMSRLYKRSLRKEHLKQILALVPDCLIVSHAFLDGKFCHRTVSINTSKMNLRPGEQIIHEKFLKDMKSSLRQSNLSFLRARHTEFLQTHHPHLKLDPERISQWHADFDLSAVHLPIIDLPPLPQAQASTATSNVEEKAVKITPEIQKAFEKYQAETMTPAKLKHIRDCSKSEIGKQNIEKLQNFELNQFALQQTFKVADEKNAESKFRTAADALRCLFRQRSKPSLPVADVLKVLQQSRGLTFKSNLDAMDMVNDIVDKLPNFFSKKKFPTHGEMIMFSSSELFPWHQPRAYPQTKQ
jgi:hypothetical protein